MSNKKYRLLKDVDSPELTAKSGSIGELDTATGRVWFDNKRFFFNLSTIQMQPDWFQEVVEPGRVEVVDITIIVNTESGEEPIRTNKYTECKQAVEAVLNNEVGLLGITVLSPNQPKYTEADIDKARKSAFEAARLLDGGGVVTGYLGRGLKYPIYENYEFSLNK
jgi:hypothetical protein